MEENNYEISATKLNFYIYKMCTDMGAWNMSNKACSQEETQEKMFIC